jgi:hypothetical protein
MSTYQGCIFGLTRRVSQAELGKKLSFHVNPYAIVEVLKKNHCGFNISVSTTALDILDSAISYALSAGLSTSAVNTPTSNTDNPTFQLLTMWPGL